MSDRPHDPSPRVWYVDGQTGDGVGGDREEKTLDEPRVDPASRLHAYLETNHWDGRGLTGPDCGIRFNFRIWRFLKSYLRVVNWRDDYYYLQAQAYWILANWHMVDTTGDDRYGRIAASAATEMLERQRGDAAWDYPNPEWAGRVATAEGTWAAIALLECHRRTGRSEFLAGTIAWYRFLEDTIGYMRAPGGLAVNYFANRPGDPVPNNSAFVLRFLAELSSAGVDVDLSRCDAMLSFLRTVQLPSGELPYRAPTGNRSASDIHFQCFQYNAFQCIDLFVFHAKTGNTVARDVAGRLCSFLQQGVAPDGHVYYDCHRPRRVVVYHAAAVAAALHLGSYDRGTDSAALSAKAYDWVLRQQRRDGSFPFSYHDYGVLRDDRAYPRNLAMILTHLLMRRSDALSRAS